MTLRPMAIPARVCRGIDPARRVATVDARRHELGPEAVDEGREGRRGDQPTLDDVAVLLEERHLRRA